LNIYEIINNRESIRNYNPDKIVDKNTLKRILTAGILAPSACNNQPWKFLIVSEGNIRTDVNNSYPREWFMDAPHILIVVGDNTKSWIRSYDNFNSIETDLTIAMDHIILAAESENVGTCWIENYDPEKLRVALNLNKNEVVFCC